MNILNERPNTRPRSEEEIEQERDERLSSIDGSDVGGAGLFIAAIVTIIALAFIPPTF